MIVYDLMMVPLKLGISAWKLGINGQLFTFVNGIRKCCAMLFLLCRMLVFVS